MLARLSSSAKEAAGELIDRGLWQRTRGGYLFHDWAIYQPSRIEVEELRRKKAEAGRKGGLASGKTRSKRGSKTEAPAKALASRLVEPPSRPDPPPSLREGGSGAPRRADAQGAGTAAPAPVPRPPSLVAAAQPPTDLLAQTRAQLQAASSRHRLAGDRRERRGLDELRAATPDVPPASEPAPPTPQEKSDA